VVRFGAVGGPRPCPLFVVCQLAVAVNDNRTIARWHTDRRWLTTGTAAALPP
jgi:hypothetical protein